MRDHLSEYEFWREARLDDADTLSSLDAMKDDPTKIKQFFSAPLSFGTAGLRGIMEAGIGGMNVYTVRQATQGFADYIKDRGMEKMGVVIAYDCRNNSRKFAEASAEVMAGNGIKTYLFESLRPTPVLSFAVRYLSCAAGINITASHNPSKYNGYKAYFSDGAQLGEKEASEVSERIRRTDVLTGAKRVPLEKGIKDGIIVIIGRDVDEAYLGEVMKQAVDPTLIPSVADELRIVYTPLHGAGRIMVPEILRRAGLKHLYTVDSQMEPNGDFPGTPNPNPEFAEVFTEGIKIAEKVKSDLIVATDPDSDRVGVMARDKNGEFKTITGNQMGALLLDYIITSYKERGILPKDAYAVKTIVTTSLAAKICRDNGVEIHDVLTGFKYIGEVIKKSEEKGSGTFLLGYEESYGYLKGTYARDKDAVVASLLICEMAAYYMRKDMTLCDALELLFKRYGRYAEASESIYMEGVDGKERMSKMMDALRASPLKEICSRRVAYIRDYSTGKITDTLTGKSKPTELPASNVLYYETEDGNAVVVRPSGTEPKLKLYYLVHSDSEEGALGLIADMKKEMKAYFA